MTGIFGVLSKKWELCQWWREAAQADGERAMSDVLAKGSMHDARASLQHSLGYLHV